MKPIPETSVLQNFTCKDCKEIAEIKGSGIKIYQYEIDRKNVMAETQIEKSGTVEITKNIFIVINLRNLPDLPMFLEDVKQQIDCKRCQYIAKRAQTYLERDRRVEKDDIYSICDHCRRKLQPCDDIRSLCDKIIEKIDSDKFLKEKTKDFAPKTRLWPLGQPYFGDYLPKTDHKKFEAFKQKPTAGDEMKVIQGPTRSFQDSSESVMNLFPQSDFLKMNKFLFPKEKGASYKQQQWMTTTSDEIIEGIRERDMIRTKGRDKTFEGKEQGQQGRKHELSDDMMDWESKEQRKKYLEKRGKYPDREMMSRSSEIYKPGRIKDTTGIKTKSSDEIQRAGKKMKRKSDRQQSDEYMQTGKTEPQRDSKGNLLPADKQYKQGKDKKQGEYKMARDDGDVKRVKIEPRRDSKGNLLPADKQYKQGKDKKQGEYKMARDDGDVKREKIEPRRESKSNLLPADKQYKQGKDKKQGEYKMARDDGDVKREKIEPRRESKSNLLPADKQYKQGKDKKQGEYKMARDDGDVKREKIEPRRESKSNLLPADKQYKQGKDKKTPGSPDEEKQIKNTQEKQLGKGRDERTKKEDKGKSKQLEGVADSMGRKTESKGTRKKEKFKKDDESISSSEKKEESIVSKEKGKDKKKGLKETSGKKGKPFEEDMMTRLTNKGDIHRKEKPEKPEKDIKIVVPKEKKRKKLPKQVKRGKGDREAYDEMVKTERGMVSKDVKIIAEDVVQPSLLTAHMKGIARSLIAGRRDATAVARAELELKVNQVVMENKGLDVIYSLSQKKKRSSCPEELPEIPKKYKLFKIHKTPSFRHEVDAKGQKLLLTLLGEQKQLIDSDIELDIESLFNEMKRKKRSTKMIKTTQIVDYNPAHYIKEASEPAALFFHSSSSTRFPAIDTSIKSEPSDADISKKTIEDDTKKVMRYALSDRSCIDKGWTMLPTEKILRRMNVYRMRPSHPEFDWIKRNKSKGFMQYDTGERLAVFENDGRTQCYYKNGRIALNYYDAEEANAKQRFVVYSDGEPDNWGRPQPVTVLAMFDYVGNGIVLDHAGKTRLKYNQTEGVVLDPTLGSTQWKWHSLNDPPVLQQVMIDTHMHYKDPEIVRLGEALGELKKEKPNDEQMLTIELDNFVKEKTKKLDADFTPYQIKMKALKINNQFSLKIIDQRTIYLLFQDGKTHITLNLGMVLDNKEIVDTETVELGIVHNALERFPAKTDSIQDLQVGLEHARKREKIRLEKENRLRPHAPRTVESSDQLNAALSRPLRTLGRLNALSPWNTQCHQSTCNFG